MRPQRLEVQGFSAFRQPVTLDFSSADLFALVGPTGAGKTSVIDAITFALYGSVPRLDDRRAVAPVVSQNLTEARVRLDFAVGSESYTAVRVVRASKTGASTKEARLQRGDDVLAGTADEVGAAIADLLGLTYDHFITCVSLPQGQFARFLHDKPRDRQDLLVRLLDLGLYDKIASVARQRAALAGGRADVLNGQLDRLSGATPAVRSEAQARVERLAALAARLAAARPELDALGRQSQTACTQAESCAAHVTALAGLQAPAGVADLAAAVAATVTTRAEARAVEEAATAELAATEARLANLPDQALLEQRRGDQLSRDELDKLVGKGRAALADAVTRVEDAVRDEAVADTAREEAAAELERMRAEQRAHALVPALRVGEPCPVCRQPVGTLPNVELPDLMAAEQALATAEGQLKQAGRVLTDARTEHVRVDEKLVRVEGELREVTERLGTTDGLGDPAAVAARLVEVVAAHDAVRVAREAERSARESARQADRGHDELQRQEVEARRAFDAARDAVATLEPPATERRDLAADWGALVAWADERRPELTEEMSAQRQRAAELDAQVSQRLAELTAACRDEGVTVDAGAAPRSARANGLIKPPARAERSWPGEAVAAAHARAEETVQRLDEELTETARLEGEIRHTSEQRQVAEALAAHLSANRFEKWLLDEAIHRLVAGASTILGDLTAAAYALSVDDRSGAFVVIDHANASQPRPARTLSGGETFLASLALALALADQVAELATGGVARLEALFLDEGFGTLDADTLDVVATALDELGARGRMVGVVTHVRELAERLPVRFEVRKVAGTASVERVDA